MGFRRIELRRPPIMHQGFVAQPEHRADVTQIAVGARVTWFCPDGLLEVRDRFGQSAAHGQSNPEVVVGIGMIRLLLQHDRIMSHRFIDTPQL